MEHKLESFTNIKKFVFGGNSTFTVHNVETGGRFTFKVTTLKGDKRGDVWFVKVMNGPNNVDNYAFMGIINKSMTRFSLTAKSKVGVDAPSYKGFNWLFGRLVKNQSLPEKVEFLHSGTCARCGRKLTTPESIKLGFGPECAGKIAF